MPMREIRSTTELEAALYRLVSACNMDRGNARLSEAEDMLMDAITALDKLRKQGVVIEPVGFTSTPKALENHLE